MTDLFEQLMLRFDLLIFDKFKHKFICNFDFFKVQSISMDAAFFLQIEQVQILFVALKNFVGFVKPWRHVAFVELSRAAESVRMH